jgi:anti-anti-sigma factor
MSAQASSARIERSGSVVRIEGEIDLANAGSLGSTIIAAITPGTDLVVDCGGITFIDSRGVAMMVEVHETARTLGSAVRWTNVQPQQRKVLQITSLTSVLIFDEPTPGGPSTDGSSEGRHAAT